MKDLTEDLEQVRKLHLEQGLEAEEISKVTGLHIRKVYRLLKKLGDTLRTPIKEELSLKMRQYLNESLTNRNKVITVLNEILDTPPRTITVKGKRFTVDNSAIKISAARALIEAQESKDKLLGLTNSELLEEIEKIEELVRRITGAK